MPAAIRTITRIQDGDDAPALGAGQNGYALTWSNGTGAFTATAIPAATTPGGSNTYVQYNASGAFAGDAGLTYDAATDALTVAGKVVSPAVTLTAPLGTPFTMHTSYITSLGVQDDIGYWAYNLLPGVTTGKVNANEPTLKFAIEANYKISEGTNLIEYNMDYLSIDSLTTKRAMSWVSDRSTQASTWNWSAGQFSLSNESNAKTFLLITTASNSHKVAYQAGSSQTGNMFEWQDSNGSALSAVQSDGGLSTNKLSSAVGRIDIPDSNFLFNKSSAGTNEKYWGVEITATQMLFRAWNDALNSANNAIAITRSGGGVTAIDFPVVNMTMSGQYPNYVLGNSSTLGVGGSSIQLRNHSPALVFENTDASANNKIWTYETDATHFFGRVLNDAITVGNKWFEVTRSTTNITYVTFPNGDVGIGNSAPASKLDVTGTVQADGLRLDITPTAETPAATHTITISVNGTNYKLLCLVA